MMVKALLLTALLAGVGSIASKAQPHSAESPEMCRVLEAAYMAAVGSKETVYPPEVQAAGRSLAPTKFTVEYVKRLALHAEEFDDLASRAEDYKRENFRPDCRWRGTPRPNFDDQGHRMAASFTNPIFATSGRLALVEVSFDDHKGFGYGMMCIARGADRAWSARCIPSWIT